MMTVNAEIAKAGKRARAMLLRGGLEGPDLDNVLEELDLIVDLVEGRFKNAEVWRMLETDGTHRWVKVVTS